MRMEEVHLLENWGVLHWKIDIQTILDQYTPATHDE